MNAWADNSEIVVGLVLDGKQPCNIVNPKSLMPPYDDLMAFFKQTGDITQIIEKFGLDPVQNALHASSTVNGTSDRADWIAMLNRSKHDYLAGQALEKMAQKLQDGESVDWSKISDLASKAQAGIGHGLTPLSEVEAMKVPFKKTGFVPIDKHFGGLPAIGQVLVGGSPGSGKTSWMLSLAASWVVEHPTESVIIFTLEMMKEELKMRLHEIYDKLTDEQIGRILVEDMPMTPEDTISVAASVKEKGLMCIDFADLLIEGETTESTMAHIYRTYMLGAKTLGIPVVVLSQLNRSYNGGIPRPFHIRYTGLAEALAWAMIMLYNPTSNWFEDTADDEVLPPVVGKAYMIGWKFRGGFRVHKDSPGAIQVSFNGEYGWNHFDNKSVWFPVKDQKPRRTIRT